MGIALICFSGLCAFAQSESGKGAEDEEQLKAGVEPISLEQISGLVSNLDRIIEGFALARDTRHRAAFQKFEEVIDHDLALYNFHKDCVEIVQYSDEENEDASDDFREWRRKLDEEVDREEFANLLRTQIQWLTLLKKVELARRNVQAKWGSPEWKEAELELAPQAISLIEEIVANGESYGKHFRDLRFSVLGTPIARAYGFSNYLEIRPELISAHPLQFENLYRNLLILPAVKNQNIELLELGWQKSMNMQREVLRLQFEVRKKEAVERGRREGRNRDRRGNAREVSRVGNFEDSPELKTFNTSILPSMMWRREIDRFNLGAEVEASRNMYALLLKYPEHPRYNNWIRSIRQLMAQSERQRKQKEAAAASS